MSKFELQPAVPTVKEIFDTLEEELFPMFRAMFDRSEDIIKLYKGAKLEAFNKLFGI